MYLDHWNIFLLTCTATRPSRPRRFYVLRRGISVLLYDIALIASVSVKAEDMLDASLNEQIVMIPKKTLIFTLHLETTIFKPPGDGPFR